MVDFGGVEAGVCDERSSTANFGALDTVSGGAVSSTAACGSSLVPDVD